MELTHEFIRGALEEFSRELKGVYKELADVFHRENQLHGRGAFSQLEGTVLYCLIRRMKPEIIYEISPDTGMSTKYILEAVAKKQKRENYWI